MRVAPHTAQASAAGNRSPAARSTRSWFRPTGGFRHPSFGLFSLRRLTSPSVEASSFIAPLDPPEVCALSGWVSPLSRPVSAITAEPSLSPASSIPPPSPPLRSEYRLAAGRVGLTLLSNVEKRMGRLRPIVRRVLVPPSSRLPIDDDPRTLLAPACQHLWPVADHGP